MAASPSKRPVSCAEGSPVKQIRAEEKMGRPRGRVMGFFAEKGGTGKSTLCHTAASLLRNRGGFKVLAIDADPQNNLSVFNTPPAILSKFTDPGARANPRDPYPNVASGQYRVTINDLLTGEIWPFGGRYQGRYYCNGNDHYDVVLGKEVPHDIERTLLSQLEPDARMHGDVREIIGRMARLVDEYDAILIDFNPTYSAVNRLLLACCDVVFNVVTLDLMCIQAFPKLIRSLDEICDLRDRLSHQVPFLANREGIRCFVVPNMVRMQGPRPIQAHSLCMDRMRQSLERPRGQADRYTLGMSTEFIPRCDNLGDHIHGIADVEQKNGGHAVAAFDGFVNAVRKTVTADARHSEAFDVVPQEWTWSEMNALDCIGRESPPGREYLYCVQLPDSYKIGKSTKFTDRHRTLLQLSQKRKAPSERGPVKAETIIFLYESDAASVKAVEANLHRYLRHTSAGIYEYYKKPLDNGEPNHDLLDVVRFMRDAQNGQSNDFCLELVCNELKTGRARAPQAPIAQANSVASSSSAP